METVSDPTAVPHLDATQRRGLGLATTKLAAHAGLEPGRCVPARTAGGLVMPSNSTRCVPPFPFGRKRYSALRKAQQASPEPANDLGTGARTFANPALAVTLRATSWLLGPASACLR